MENGSFDRKIDRSDSDRLHQSDWSAQRMGRALCEVICFANSGFLGCAYATKRIRYIRRMISSTVFETLSPRIRPARRCP